MQVHKETIDKVPNSIPNRSNIEIEIFGMDGIPQEDLRDHERQKSGSTKSESDDDEPAVKRTKPEGKIFPCIFNRIVRYLYFIRLFVANVMQQPNMMMPNMPPHMMAQFGMGMPMPMQPFMMMPHQMMMQPRPLFPAAAAASTMGQHQMAPKPTFPAYRLVFIQRTLKDSLVC